MKGTARRGKTPEEDEALRKGLKGDAKNQAENRMIVDLLRNDISRITTVGSLHVPELFTVETYPSLHQMISRIRAKLLPGLTIRDIFGSAVPLRVDHRRAENPRHGNSGTILRTARAMSIAVRSAGSRRTGG